MVSTLLIAMALGALPLAFAHSHPDNGTTTSVVHPSSTSSVAASTQTVAVGQNGLTFAPDTVHAKTGDEIVFEFYPKNHAVVQADFNNPCNPKADGQGIFSGFVPSAVGRANRTFTIKIQDEHKPMWLYCPQNNPRSHCAAGMVAVINPPMHSPNTLDAFKLAAAMTGNATSPAAGPAGGQLSDPPTPPAPGTTGAAGPSAPSGPSGTPPVGAPPGASGTPSATSSAPTSGSSAPVESTGAGSMLAVNLMLGLMGALAAVAL